MDHGTHSINRYSRNSTLSMCDVSHTLFFLVIGSMQMLEIVEKRAVSDFLLCKMELGFALVHVENQTRD